MRIVIDASVALKWVLAEVNTDAADALLAEELIAPSLWLIEAANALWRRSRRGEFDLVEARALLGELQRAPVASVPAGQYADAALTLAGELAHPVYDCLYLAVAVANRTHVVTADRRFAALGEKTGMNDRIRLLAG